MMVVYAYPVGLPSSGRDVRERRALLHGTLGWYIHKVLLCSLDELVVWTLLSSLVETWSSRQIGLCEFQRMDGWISLWCDGSVDCNGGVSSGWSECCNVYYPIKGQRVVTLPLANC